MDRMGTHRGRISWGLIVGLVIGIAVSGVIIYNGIRSRQRAEFERRQYQTVQVFRRWASFANEHNAQESLFELNRQVEALGDDIDVALPDDLAISYRRLASKFFDEQKYAKAFEMYQKASMILDWSEVTEPHAYYFAALAGRLDWLDSHTSADDEGDSWRPLMAEVCKCFAQGDYDGVLAATESNAENAALNISAASQNSNVWMVYLRVKAFAEQGNMALAYREMKTEVYGTLDGGIWMQLNVILDIARIGEYMGEYQYALRSLRNAKRILETPDGAFRSQCAKLQAMIDRIEQKIASECE